MGQFVIRRIVLAIPTFLIAMVVIFFSIRLIPGDELTALIGENRVGAEDRAALKKQLGLDDPVHVAFFKFLTGVLRGDLGKGTFDSEPVTKKVADRIDTTLQLTIMAAVIASAVAIPVGVISAIRRNSLLDYALRFFSIMALGVPSFWIATLVLIYGTIWFGWVPEFGQTHFFSEPWRNLNQFLVPSIILGLLLCGSLMRITRSQMLEVLNEDYIRTARSKGLRGHVVITRHAVRNALIPVITVMGIQIALLLGGTIIIESIFGLHGLGTLMTSALSQRDYPVVQGVNVVAVTIVVVVNLFVDVSYVFIDPRLRHAET